MIEQKINFSDGTRIFYEKTNGTVKRYIEYAFTPQEIEEMRTKPFLKESIENRKRKYNAGIYYYLDILRGITSKLDDNQRHQLYNELKILHDKVGQKYDTNILRNKFLETFGKYWPDCKIQIAAFFVTIYLAMLDLEEDKCKYKNSIGKTMVLKSCEAVIIKEVDPGIAATMFKKKKNFIPNDNICDDYDFCYDKFYSPYEKYNGYNGFDDDTIDIAFDGHPEATWNVD